jgi:hypothetical protein
LTGATPRFQQSFDHQESVDGFARINGPAAGVILRWGKAKSLAPLSQLFNAKARKTLNFGL